jgi:PIN domain nuclease of toxin-antitoxin system
MPAELAVTDTHALLWAVGNKRARLGRRARAMFERADAGNGAIYVPTIALVEVAEAIHAGRASLASPFEEWVAALRRSGRYIVADLTADVVIRAHALYAIPERGDRLIAATAAVLGVPLMTRDPAIAAAADIDRLWE